MKLQDILKVKGTDVYTITPNVTLAEVIETLVKYNCGSLVVCESEQMVGIITERDILKACAADLNNMSQALVQTQMSVNLTTGSPDDDVSYIMGLMTQKRIRHLPIVSDGKLAGLISIGDVVKAQHSRLSMENHYLKEYIQG